MLETDIAPQHSDNKTIYLKDYQAPLYAIDTVDMRVELGEEATLVTTKMSIRKTSEHNQALLLDGEKMTLLSVELDGKPIANTDYQLTDHNLSISHLPNQFSLTITTEIKPQENTELSGLYKSSGNFCTQCEAEGFRRITYFLDRPDVLSVYTTTIVADSHKYPVLLSNGNLLETGSTENGQHFAVWHDPHPKPSYLFALVAGDLKRIEDKFTTASGNEVDLYIYTQAHNINKCQHAMESLIKSMQWDEQVYGREYDLDVYNIVAVDDFNMGAMENKGLNVFNSKYVLARQEIATDADYEGIESVIGHEYFHNWSGNRVTCRDWFQLSLKEGFTVFRDQEFSADMGSRGVKRIQDVRILRTHQFREDAGPMAHPIRPDAYQEINNFYTVTVYNKGAEVVRMLYNLLGKKQFRKGTDYYFDQYDGQAVTTEHFVSAMERANNINLSQFRYWYSQAGTPILTVTEEYDKTNQQYNLTITQTCPETPGQKDKHPFHIPVLVQLWNEQGEALTKESTLELTQVSQQFTFDNLSSRPIVSFLRGFSAPVKVEFKQNQQDLVSLIKYDNDGFVRWESMQKLMLTCVLTNLEQQQINVEQSIIDALRHLLTAPATDKAIVAEMLTLPSQAYIAECIDEIDPANIHRVHEAVTVEIAQQLEQELLTVYKANNDDSEYSLLPAAIAQRALKNVCLSYLLNLEKQDVYELASKQYNQANNMTDRIAAFSGLVNSAYPHATELIEDFYQNWKQESLVLDKWFAIQADAKLDNTLQKVQALLSHPDFSMKNPNKVRALIGAFAGNSVSFHKPDGSGYEFLADCILQLNELNPQIAARLMGVFNMWNKYEPDLAGKMRLQIERINNNENLSRDVKEIASKALLHTK